MSNSLDLYIHDADSIDRLNQEDRKRFQRWIAKLAEDPVRISSKVEEALRNSLVLEWESESKNHKFKLGSYYPSIIEHCLRQQAYSYIEPSTPTPEALAIFSEGKAIHELIASILRQSGFVSVEGKEVVVDLEFPEAKLHGRIDDLLLLRLADKRPSSESSNGDYEEFALYVPLEIKSTSSLPDKPKENHYFQLSTYLLAKELPFGVLLYWAKREGKVKAFTIQKDEAMYQILQGRVLEIHEALKSGGLPQKEAVFRHDYQQCERCVYSEKCNPFLVDRITKGSKISIFDIDTILLDTSPRRKAVLQTLGLPSSTRASDIEDEETKSEYWDLYNSEKFVQLDVLNEIGKQMAYQQNSLGRILVGISAGRREELGGITEAALANFGLPISLTILRETGNFETDSKFKIKWALRLANNYEVVEYFDRDAVTSSLVKRALDQHRERRENKNPQESTLNKV